ncbi:hypothetical protein [Streptomyces sp. NPDC046860]|uniref:hypothetical protein n=1 Tax=Streptomyces sp. NPDC046860 TaxID=3154495 RepID=UPI0033C43247
MNAGVLITLAALSPVVVPLWGVAAGLIGFRIGRRAESARLGWLFFLVVGLLPAGAVFALLGLTPLVFVVGIVAGLIALLLILDRFGDQTSAMDPEVRDE